MIHLLPTASTQTTPTNQRVTFLMRFSQVRIFPHVVQTKNETFLGTLRNQILFHGKGTAQVPRSTL